MEITLSYEDRLKIAKKWADRVIEKYGDLVKFIVLFGSMSRGEITPQSDIDLVVIVDDTKGFSPKFLEKFDKELENIANTIEGSKIKFRNSENGKMIEENILEIHPTYTLTEFWDNVRIGNPVIYNIIKEGVALYDVGIFEPLQRLWLKGKIPYTKEAVNMYMKMAVEKIERAEVVKIMQIAEDCYYAIINSAYAFLMSVGKDTVPPKKLSEELQEYLVSSGILEPHYVEWIQEIVELREKTKHREIKEFKGDYVDLWIERSKKFVRKMQELIKVNELVESQKIVHRTLEVLYKAVIDALVRIEEPLPESLVSLSKIESNEEFIKIYWKMNENEIKDLKEYFKRTFVNKGYIEPVYLKIWNRLEELTKCIEAGRLEKLNMNEILSLREMIRIMIRKLSKVLERN